MADHNAEHGGRREGRRRYSSDSEDERVRRGYNTSGRSYDEPQHSHRNGGRKADDLREDRRSRCRSRSPRGERPVKKERRSSDSLYPESRDRSYRDDGRSSRRNRSASRSPPPKRRRHDSRDDRRRSSNRHPHHRHSPSVHRPGFAANAPPGVPLPSKRSHAPLPSQQDAFTKDPKSDAAVKPPPEAGKQKPNYAPTGMLAAETNTVANTSIVLKYNEPPEARLPPPSAPWRLYIFKGSDLLETLQLHQRSCWLFGRERAVVDFPTEHPSCSKQHAVLQFRYTEKKNEWGERTGGVKPYIIDLESANGTKVNGESVPDRRYWELRSGDVITFGESTREYVTMLPPKEDKKG